VKWPAPGSEDIELGVRLLPGSLVWGPDRR
jgi:hypothetical protein